MFDLPFIGLKPVEFHPYTSHVTKRVFEVECSNSEDLVRAYKKFEKALQKEFERAGIKTWIDNKIVFGFTNGEQMIYFGFYDWKFSIGLSYRDENETHYDGKERGKYSYKNATKETHD